jgi:preprotein translocase subunit SecD
VTGFHLERARAGEDAGGRPAVSFTLSKEGGDLFFALTSENRPSKDGDDFFKRRLAVVVDGRVVTAPTLLSPIRAEGQITGDFTPAQVDAMVATLKSDMGRKE